MSQPISRQRPWEELMKKLGYTFKDPSHLYRACTHLSCAGTERKYHLTNQRLEFLGDAALRVALAQLLYQRWPTASEGDLTKEVSRLSSNENLARMAGEIDLPRFILLGKSAGDESAANQPGVKADAFEAVIGAILQDGGYDAMLAFVKRRFKLPTKPPEEKVYGKINPKGELQERLAKISPKAVPEYYLLKSEGPDHKRTFFVELRVAGEEISTGRGSTRQKAEFEAAQKAIDRMREEEKRSPGDYPVA
jgi:ribonuclease-3